MMMLQGGGSQEGDLNLDQSEGGKVKVKIERSEIGKMLEETVSKLNELTFEESEKLDETLNFVSDVVDHVDEFSLCLLKEVKEFLKT